MAVVENRFVCDLSKPVQAQALKGNVFSLDNLGSRLSVLIYDNGQPATISGSVTANCILPDGSTVNVNGGLTSEGDGSKAYVDIPQSCLLIPGILKIAIKCTSSSVITTLAAIVANVYMTKTDNVITPSQQIITDWNAEISASLANQDAEISDLKGALLDTNHIVMDQLGSNIVRDVAVAKGSTKTLLLTFDLFAGETVNISFVLASGINKSTYAYLYDANNNNLWSNDSIGIPANTTLREITYTPSQNYKGAKILYTITSSASTDAVISISVVSHNLKGMVNENTQAISDLLTLVNKNRSKSISEIKSITESTENLFNVNGEPLYVNNVLYSVDGNNITVESATSATYAHIEFVIPASGISKVIVCPYTADGTGDARVRIGYSSDGKTPADWIGNPVTPGNTATFDVSRYNYVVVGLYSVWSSGGEIGKYVTYNDIMISAGNNTVEDCFLPYRSAVDYNLRKWLLQSTVDISNKTLADDALWENGSIDDVTGINVSQSRSIRLIGFIEVDKAYPLYLQAYYDVPTTISGATTRNTNLNNAYIYQYNDKYEYISRITYSSTNILTGRSITLSSLCKFIRIAFYTTYVDKTVAEIRPNTIWIDQKKDEFWLPPYYDTYLVEKAEVIQRYLRYQIETTDPDTGAIVYKKVYSPDANIIPFYFITDEHAPQYNPRMYSPAIIHRLETLLNVPIPMLFSGGDVDQNGTQTNVFCDALRSAYNGEIHHAVGNHDFLRGNTGTSLYVDMDMTESNQQGSKDHHYYFVDNEQLKIRFIVLAAYMESQETITGSGSAKAQGGYTQEQKTWITNTAIGTLPTGWKMIVFTHYFYMITPPLRPTDPNYDPEHPDYSPVVLSYGWDILREFAANENTLAVFQGHTHYDRIIQGFSENVGNLPIVVTACDKNAEFDDEYFLVNRSSGTVYEQLFDVAIINQETKKINLVRIGGLAENGLNNYCGNPVEVRTVSYDRS